MSSVQQAKAVMLYNLATVFCVMKDYDKAKQSLQKVGRKFHTFHSYVHASVLQASPLFSGNPPQLVLLSAYIELAKGKAAITASC